MLLKLLSTFTSPSHSHPMIRDGCHFLQGKVMIHSYFLYLDNAVLNGVYIYVIDNNVIITE